MSMPVINPGTVSRCQAISDIIESVALQQTALAHILNAEGEKIQRVVAMPSVSVGQLIDTNTSVESMIDAVIRLETVLQAKLALFGDCLCDCCTGC